MHFMQVRGSTRALHTCAGRLRHASWKSWQLQPQSGKLRETSEGDSALPPKCTPIQRAPHVHAVPTTMLRFTGGGVPYLSENLRHLMITREHTFVSKEASGCCPQVTGHPVHGSF